MSSSLAKRLREVQARQAAERKPAAPLSDRVKASAVTAQRRALDNPTTKQLDRWGIKPCDEFVRVDRLPRRTPKPHADHVRHYTDLLKTPGGRWELRDIQAWALHEIEEYGGILGCIAVGGGKALISLLAPVLLGAKRPVLMLPAALRDQTNEHVIPQMREHWKLHDELRVISYETLSSAKNADILERIEPDVLICDEAHYLKNPRAGRTKRVVRYMKGHESTIFVALSGTITRRSLKDYWHLAAMARREGSPLPKKFPVVDEWSNLLDAEEPMFTRPGAGALSKWCSDEELMQQLSGVRKAFQRRFAETPGIITTRGSSVDTGLNIKARRIQMPAEVANEILNLEQTWETHNGDVLMDAVSVWRHTVELCCGFYYRWDPPAPQDWLEARRGWNKYVQHVLKHNRRQLDTPMQVANECRLNPKRAPEEFYVWEAIENTFKPNRVPVHISRYLVDDAEKWAKETGGIVWVSHRAVGSLFETIPFFGRAGDGLLDHRGPCAASLAVHGTGKELQHYKSMLVMVSPSSGLKWEQALGRLHRPGQLADTVEVELYQHHDVLVSAWQDGLRDARYIEDITGQRQKLLLSTRIGLTDPD